MSIKPLKKKLWLTYSWADNRHQGIDLIIQKLRAANIDPRFDRQQIEAGRFVWQQIAENISNPQNSDGWAYILSLNALQSKPCEEELYYALDRALKARGQEFKLFGILLEPIEHADLPAPIRTRLYVNVNDPIWIERISSSLQGKELRLDPPELTNCYSDVHLYPDAFFLEVGPRIGQWAAAEVIVPSKPPVYMNTALVAARGQPPIGAANVARKWHDAEWFGVTLDRVVDPRSSIFIQLLGVPEFVLCKNGDEEHKITREEIAKQIRVRGGRPIGR